jgi:hypothetical protein
MSNEAADLGCPDCGGSGFVKLPLGAPEDGREVEDEDNCYCHCHAALTAERKATVERIRAAIDAAGIRGHTLRAILDAEAAR